jgi:hypothetical protein
MRRDRMDDYADIYAVLRLTWGINQMAADSLLHHGHVKIDGHVIAARWCRNHWRKRQLVGRILECPRGQVRLYGSALDRGEILSEQLKLGDRRG